MIAFWERVRSQLTAEYRQSDLCRAIDVTTSKMTNWIRFDRIPTADYAVKIGTALGVSVEWLVTGEELDLDEYDAMGIHNRRLQCIVSALPSLSERQLTIIELIVQESRPQKA